ncbi:hypothetical protein HPB52_007867 [Rhipicephalus sanguineus]|uniref:Uncharacterized protein n=1 Tax=Rhipicephalus sanguineus TaxID=34632 RepID=A0A9D4Q5I9_RHISA|nr:hypothetical protein HPB52_007867 [Rhipicephalus sanguineus]
MEISEPSAEPHLKRADLAALRELVRSVVREELEKVRPTPTQPTVTVLGDIIRDEIRNVTQPSLPTRVEAPVLSYAEALRSPQSPAARRPTSSFPGTPQTPSRHGHGELGTAAQEAWCPKGWRHESAHAFNGPAAATGS